MNTKANVRIYACGGGGINIVSQLPKVEEVGIADFSPAYVDTSDSNIRRLRNPVDPKEVFILEGTDGSGQLRAENHEVITKHIREILQVHKPMEMNIVVSTGAGGSGSVIAPLIAAELMERNLPFVVVTIGVQNTRNECLNTLKTLKSYAHFSATKGKPIVMNYVENTSTQTRDETNESVIWNITGLLALFSRENRELDSKDLFNWINYNRVTTHKPQLSALHLLLSNKAEGLGNVISVATIARDNTITSINQNAEYQCVGYMDPECGIQAEVVHFVTCDGILPKVIDRLTTKLEELDQATAARVVVALTTSADDTVAPSGLVL